MRFGRISLEGKQKLALIEQYKFTLFLKFNPAQARVPAGQTGGGQWMNGSGASFTPANNFTSQDKQKPIDLRNEEKSPPGYGHTIDRHVAKSDADLISRLNATKKEFTLPNGAKMVTSGRSVGSFRNVDEANYYVNEVLSRNSDVVDKVLQDKPKGNVFMQVDFNENTGYESYVLYPTDQPKIRETTNVRVAIRYAPSLGTYQVISAYPTNRNKDQ
jgi:Bacterial CdiA-CT RNAse A domain